MMQKNLFKFLISIFLLILGVSGFSQLTDSLDLHSEPDSLQSGLDQYEIEDNDHILAMLDSLVALNFYSDTSFQTDTAILNVFGFSPDFVPEYPDSVYEQRIAALNNETFMELGFNKYVKNYIVAYTKKRREVVSRVLGLSELYFPLFEETLDKYNMPLELKYLAIVESALNPTANSRAGAKGLWQFMYGTGKAYGLKVTSLVDDRFDPIKSTDAACRHLKDLYDIYGNWSLAMAAYNSGAGNVNKAIRRAGGKKSYWAVWPFLPRETRGYVPAFIAVTYAMNYAAEHNLYPIDPGILAREIDTVTVKDVLAFDQISELMQVSVNELKLLNPSFKRGIIPATEEKPYTLRLPFEKVMQFVDVEDSLYAYKTSKGIERESLLKEIKKAQERNIHIVRSGENLGLIANRYRVSVSKLKSWNNLRGNTIYPGQKLVVFAPGYYGNTTSGTSSTKGKSKGDHVVKSGENLGLIAKKYGCRVSDLKNWNNISGNLIQPGQKLVVYKPEKKSDDNKETVVNSDGEFVYHTVKQGDTLWDIAKLYDGVTVDQIKKLNNISNSRRLKPGQKLKVAVKG